MSYQVLPIKIGYSQEKDGFQRADASITLLKGPQNIIVDLGNAWDKDYLLNGNYVGYNVLSKLALSEHSVKPNDINIVICTHSHSDHIGNLNMFCNSKYHLIGHELYCKDLFFSDPFLNGQSFVIDSEVSVISTPGHSESDISVIVNRNSEYGTIVIAGDIFEKAEDLLDPTIWKRMSANTELQIKSRTKILNIADTIIPGHGPLFRVPLNYKRIL